MTEYNPENPVNIRVRDHCHVTGKYPGSVHRNCNLKFCPSPQNIKIPVIFHNLKGYDSHFIMQKIGQLIREKSVFDFNVIKNEESHDFIEVKEKIDVNVITCNFEKYITFRLGRHLTFIDSFQFMSQSLDKLSSNLPEDGFIHTKDGLSTLSRLTPRQYGLIKRKVSTHMIT